MISESIYILAVLLLIAASIIWRVSTVVFLARFDVESRFSPASFAIDMHIDFFRACYLMANHRTLSWGTLTHGVFLIAMWMAIVSGPLWGWGFD